MNCRRFPRVYIARTVTHILRVILNGILIKFEAPDVHQKNCSFVHYIVYRNLERTIGSTVNQSHSLHGNRQ